MSPYKIHLLPLLPFPVVCYGCCIVSVIPEGRKIWSNAFLQLDVILLKAEERVYVKIFKGKVTAALELTELKALAF